LFFGDRWGGTSCEVTIASVAIAGSELRNDPLSPYARAQHRNLLIASSVGFLFLVLKPERISALGISIESSKRGWILFILLAAVIYFEFAFFAASRADYHLWRQTLSRQRDHLNALREDAVFKSAQAQLDQNLADGEDPAEITRRRREVQASEDEQRQTRKRLVPVVRSLAVRGWIDFSLAPLYGVAVASVLLYQLIRQLT
jgi:hypothetical protein